MRRLLLIIFTIILLLAPVNVFSEDIELGWDANTEPDLVMYVMYRSETSGSHVLGIINSPHYLGTIACTANDTSCTSFWDMDLPWETTFYYIVTAVDLAQHESGKSNEVSYTTPVEPDLPPNNPTGCYVRTVVP